MNNYCRFIEQKSESGELNILHFVRENEVKQFDGWKILPYYRVHLVVEGKGSFHTPNGVYELNVGDVFICGPSAPYGLEGDESFSYMYIGYVGTRANAFMYKLKVYASTYVFNDCGQLLDLWKSAIDFSNEMLGWSAEGVLMLTFAVIGEKLKAKENKKEKESTIDIVKKYIDDNFTDSEMSLSKVSKALAYNPNYISVVIKNNLGVSFKEYVNVLRINNACALMEKGFTGIQDISSLCGFNDPLYFSKVFKSVMKQTPSQMLLKIKEQAFLQDNTNKCIKNTLCLT